MPDPALSLVVSLARSPGRWWRAEVTDAASPVAGLIVRGPTRGSVCRRIAIAAVHELGLCDGLLGRVEVIAWRTFTFSLRRR